MRKVFTELAASHPINLELHNFQGVVCATAVNLCNLQQRTHGLRDLNAQ